MTRKYDFSAKVIIDCCQNLYEKYKIITYPRSDCRYLPEALWHEKEKICAIISHNFPELTTSIQK